MNHENKVTLTEFDKNRKKFTSVSRSEVTDIFYYFT